MKITATLPHEPNVTSNYNYRLKKIKKTKPIEIKPIETKPNDPVIVINSHQNQVEKSIPKIIKNSVPKQLRKSKFTPTEEQKLRIYRTYIQPQLDENNIENQNVDLVQSIKEAFGKDNKEQLNNTLPTFSYENESVRQQMSRDLFDTETKIQAMR